MPSQQNESESHLTPPPQDALVRYTVFGQRSQPVTADEAFDEIYRALEAMAEASPEEVAAAKAAFAQLAADCGQFEFLSATREEKPEWFHSLDDGVVEGLLLAGRAPEASDQAALQEARTTSVLTYQGPPWEGHQHLELMKRLADVVAQLSDGIVADFVSLALYGNQSWQEVMSEERPHALNHLSLHSVDGGHCGGDGVWIHTHGMTKFALPDLELRRVPPNFQETGAGLLLEAAQWMIENGDVPFGTVHSFGPYSIEWVFMPMLGEEEHYRGPVLGLIARGDNPFEPEKMGEGLFRHSQGNTEEIPMETIGEDDAEIDAACEQALVTLPSFESRYQAAQDAVTDDNSFLVKIAFKTPEETEEYMWVTITDWESDQIKGVLMNAPNNVPGLSGGQEVSVQKDDVRDWMIIKQDRTWEGAFIDQILMRRSGQEMPETM